MAEIIIFFIGLAAAIRGAEWVGSSAIKFAKQLGVSEIFIGATLVSLATTLPELSIATISGIINHDTTIALGTVLGSPIVNLGFILGIFFFVTGDRPKLGFYSRSLNIFLLISLLLLAFSFYKPIGSVISVILIIFGLGFIALEILISRQSISWVEKEKSRFETFLNVFAGDDVKMLFVEFVAGALLLTVGSKYVIEAVVAISSSLKIDEFYISITLLALGSSLPELITAITSIIRKRDNIAIGNLVGASVIDVTLGVGLATISKPTWLNFPQNLFIFLPLLIICGLCLSTLLKKTSVQLVGILLLASSAIFLALFSIYQII